MADHERGAYTPPTQDSPLAFEAREPVRGSRPFPLTLVVSVVVLLGLAGALFVLYRSGLRHGGDAPQVVGAPVGELKSAAPPEAQPQDASQGLEIYRSESGQQPQLVPTPPQFTPGPEQPQPRPQSGPAVVVTPPATLPPATAGQPALRPTQAAPPPPPPEATAAQTTAKSAPPITPKAPMASAPPTQAKPAPKAAAPAPKPAEKAAAAKPAASAAKGAAAVQIGAVSSEALADKTWDQAVAVAPGLAMGKGKGVEKVEKDGKTLYRTSVTGFASRAEAQAFCDKLKAAGKACFVK
jgi:hypothetical protein